MTIPEWEQDEDLKVFVYLRAIGFKHGLDSGKILAFYRTLRQIIGDVENVSVLISESPVTQHIGGLPVVTNNRFFFQVACDRRKDEVALYKAIFQADKDKTLCMDSIEVIVSDVNRYAFNDPEKMGPMFGGPNYRPLREALRESPLWMPKLSTDLSLDPDYDDPSYNDIYVMLRAPHISNAMTINLWNIAITNFDGVGYVGPFPEGDLDYILFAFPVCSDMGDTTKDFEIFVDMFAERVTQILSHVDDWEYCEVQDSCEDIEEILDKAIEKGFEPIKDWRMAYTQTIPFFDN